MADEPVPADISLREEVARALSPYAFEEWDRRITRRLEQGKSREEAERFAKWGDDGTAAIHSVRYAFEQADRLIAHFPALTQPEGGGELDDPAIIEAVAKVERGEVMTVREGDAASGFLLGYADGYKDGFQGRDKLRAALEPFASLEAREEWPDIATAPKDGKPFMVWGEGFGWPEVVMWQAYSTEDAEEIGEAGYWTYAEELMANVTDTCSPEEWTHWRPLPAPPASKGGG